MHKPLLVLALSFTLGVPVLATGAPEVVSKIEAVSATVSAAVPAKAEGAAAEEFNKNMAMVGGGALGILLASGVAGLLSSGSMMFEGAAFSEAMEAGAGLSLSMTFLSAVLGAVFAQDMALRVINAYNAKDLSKLTH
ncbi:membrane hypothetical protein [Gammaproteobacteria bacterium]